MGYHSTLMQPKCWHSRKKIISRIAAMKLKAPRGCLHDRDENEIHTLFSWQYDKNNFTTVKCDIGKNVHRRKSSLKVKGGTSPRRQRRATYRIEAEADNTMKMKYIRYSPYNTKKLFCVI